jgi:tetratricopeptide (TPR) repeat protein
LELWLALSARLRDSLPSGVRVLGDASARHAADRGWSLGEIGDRTGARYVLEGTFRSDAEGRVVDLRLHDLASDRVAWRSSEAIPEGGVAIDAIARDISAPLGLGFTGDASGDPWLSPELARSWLRARFLASRGDREGRIAALQVLDSVADAVHEFAPALALRADLLMAEDAWDGARDAARAALAVDPASAVALRVLGELSLYRDRDPVFARVHLLQARAAAPRDPQVRTALGLVHVILGERAEAIEQVRDLIALDPVSTVARGDAAIILYFAGDAEGAVVEARRTRDLTPDWRPALEYLMRALESVGRVREAVEPALALMSAQGANAELVAATARAGTPEDVLRNYRTWLSGELASARGDWSYARAVTAAQLGDHAAALEHLRAAYARSNRWVVMAPADPRLSAIRDRPGFPGRV